MVVFKNEYMSSYREKLSNSIGFDRKNLSAALIIAFGMVVMGGYGASQVASGYDVSIGQNGIKMGTGTLDVMGNDIESSGTTIWDASSGYIPEAQMQTANLVWGDLGIAKTDISASNVGLGNVLNKEQLAVDGSNSMTGDLNISKNNLTGVNWVISKGGGFENINLKASSILVNGASITEIDTVSGQSNNGLAMNTFGTTTLKARGTSSQQLDIISNDRILLKTDADSTSTSCTIDNSANLNCDGSKNWIHQINSTHEAVYSSQESPQVRAVFEGKAHVVNKKKIELPEHFSMTVSNTKPMLRVQVTPQGKVAAVGVLEKTDDYIKIGVSKETDVNFRITGIREGYEDKQVVRPK